MTAKLKPLCPYCSSDNVAREAACLWNPESQAWETETVYDDGNCNDCGRETKEFNWIDLADVKEGE